MQYLDDLDLYPLSQNKTTYQDLKFWKDRWIEDLIIKKVSQKSITSYNYALDTFMKFVRYNKIEKINKISARYINRYLIKYQIELAKSKNHPLANQLIKESQLPKIGKNDANFTIIEDFESTLNHRITVLKMFLKFITENNSDLHDFTPLFSKIANVKIKDKITSYLMPKEIEKVIMYLKNWEYEYKKYFSKSSKRDAIRNAFLLTLYAITGARGDEVTHIKLKDIEEYHKEDKHYYLINIEEAKGGKKRRIIVHRYYIEHFVEYFKLHLPSSDYYIATTYKNGAYTNKPIHINTLRAFNNKFLKIIGINKSGLHIYRRGYATKRIGIDKVDISLVAKELGNTTAILEKHYLKYTPEIVI
jgi:integrase/recombinase XerD